VATLPLHPALPIEAIMTRRTERVSELLREELSEILQRQVKDPRLAVILSITEVEVSPDLKAAKVYLSVLGDDAAENDVFLALKSATPFIRHELRPRLASLRYTPELMFLPDHSIERGARLSALIDQVVAEEEHSS
jgi:ribosome-binding factor A